MGGDKRGFPRGVGQAGADGMISGNDNDVLERRREEDKFFWEDLIAEKEAEKNELMEEKEEMERLLVEKEAEAEQLKSTNAELQQQLAHLAR